LEGCSCIFPCFFWSQTTDFTCMAKVWIVNLGFLLLYASLCVKEWRIYKIFSTDINKKVIISDTMLLKGASLLASPSILVLVLWTIISPYKSIEEHHPDKLEIVTVCRSSTDVFLWLLMSYDFLLLICGCVMAFLTRNSPSNYNESKHIAFSVYNGTVTIVAIVLVVSFLGTPVALFLSVTVTILFTTTVTLCSIFGGKFYAIFLRTSRVLRLENKIVNTEQHLQTMKAELQRLKALEKKNESSSSVQRSSATSFTSTVPEGSKTQIERNPKGSKIIIRTATPEQKINPPQAEEERKKDQESKRKMEEEKEKEKEEDSDSETQSVIEPERTPEKPLLSPKQNKIRSKPTGEKPRSSQ